MTKRYWFRAKRYGWGWGLPLTWEGWAVLAAYIALVAAAAAWFPPHQARTDFVACVTLLTAVLLAVCWLTGPPPRWRWGDDDEA